MPWDDAARARFVAWANEKALPCSACGSESWNADTTLAACPTEGERNSLDLTFYFPMIWTSCKECGYVRFFSAKHWIE
jgi:predicted nucleic-acid-binding Zn-ribbon protein